MSEDENRTKVTILTRSYRIRGYIDLVHGARVTDFMAEAKDFIAVTDAEIYEPEFAGRLVLKTSFVNVGREHIEIIFPE